MTSHSGRPVQKKKTNSTGDVDLWGCPRPPFASQSDPFSPFHIPHIASQTDGIPPLPLSLPDPQTHRPVLPKDSSPNSRRSHLSGPVRRVLVELIRRCILRFLPSALPLVQVWPPGTRWPRQSCILAVLPYTCFAACRSLSLGSAVASVSPASSF